MPSEVVREKGCDFWMVDLGKGTPKEIPEGVGVGVSSHLIWMGSAALACERRVVARRGRGREEFFDG